MSAAQHVSGPWKAVRNASFWEVVTPLPGQTLDQANEYSPSLAYVWGEGEEQAEANARLIAAAPDLLEALQHLMVAHGEQLDYAFQQAQEAIAKATGGAA
jgi:hypothetical protein